jgi:hypothetical protein
MCLTADNSERIHIKVRTVVFAVGFRIWAGIKKASNEL